VNNAAGVLTGYSREELLGRNYLELVQPEFKMAVRQFYITQLEERRSGTYHEFPVVRKDGTIMWLGQTASLEEDRQGVMFSVIARDVSSQIKAERVWQGKNAQLLVLI